MESGQVKLSSPSSSSLRLWAAHLLEVRRSCETGGSGTLVGTGGASIAYDSVHRTRTMRLASSRSLSRQSGFRSNQSNFLWGHITSIVVAQQSVGCSHYSYSTLIDGNSVDFVVI